MRQIITEIIINARAEQVWRVLTGFEDYPRWNPFIRSISGNLKEGEKLSVFLKPPGAKGMTFHPKVIKSESGKEFRWKGKLLFPGLFDGEHYFLLEEIGVKRTLFTHGEKFSGLMIPFLKGMLEKTKAGFEIMNKNLKRECQRQVKATPIQRSGNRKTGVG